MSCCKNVKICMFQGDDLRIVSPVVDETGDPVDITGVTSIKWQLSQRPNSTAILSKGVGTGIVISSVDEFYFDIASSETENLLGNYYHEVEIVTDTGKRYTTISGSFVIKPTQIKP